MYSVGPGSNLITLLEVDLRTRILIADDHPIFRSGLKTELSRHTDFEIAGEAVDGDEVIVKVIEGPVDVVILDISMPGIKAVDVIRRLGKSHPAIKVLVLTAHGDKGTITSILKAGAHGYILKEEDPFVVPEAIRSVIKGRNWVGPSVATLMMGKFRENPSETNSGVLTEKECEVIRLIADGLSTRDIASRTHMAERTVEFHISNIYDKLGVNTRPSAVRWAQEHGIL
jgi:DNA-binding NarL/FixJ family response regulator